MNAPVPLWTPSAQRIERAGLTRYLRWLADTHGRRFDGYEALNTPSVWRSARSQAAAKVDALASNGMDEIEIPAFLRKQAD
mgnify:CR=1 FL=1